MDAAAAVTYKILKDTIWPKKIPSRHHSTMTSNCGRRQWQIEGLTTLRTDRFISLLLSLSSRMLYE